MQRKVERLSQQLNQVLSTWSGIEAVVLGEAAEAGILDPYFTISLDVYHHSGVPQPAERKQLFANPTAFDTVPGFTEDRFLLEELPVKIRYQATERVDFMLKRIADQEWIFHDASTYLFYRLLHGQVLQHATTWLEQTRNTLSALPDHFWRTVRNGARISAAYYLNDLRAAVYRGDGLFYTFSLSHFLRSLCSFLFALNQTFEPSDRLVAERVLELPRLPDGFGGRFESMLRDNPELPPKRKLEVAELLVKSILPME
ncbi:MAG: DUF4037 domain-containing protein [Spirochaetaceae bacterium]|nr:MAG: DUF4037 domain-containing protein [Spirochaetaceae bacterium]